MQNEPLVAEILEAVVNAVDVPVTLKTRLGWHNEHQNLPTIAKIAEESGIAALPSTAAPVRRCTKAKRVTN